VDEHTDRSLSLVLLLREDWSVDEVTEGVALMSIFIVVVVVEFDVEAERRMDRLG